MIPEDQKMEEPVLELARVLSRENLREGWRAVKTNRGAPGIDGMDIAKSAEHMRAHWSKIEAKLLTGAYTPGAVKAVEIPKASGGTRTLGIPNVTDRVIQQAIHQKLSPAWEPEFSDHSHGFRPGRSAHDAVREAQGFIREGKTWVVDIDLKGFFDEVNHDKLMGMIARKVRDKTLLKLIGDYLRAPLQRADGSREKRVKGTPQGGPLSPLLANIYLHPLDMELEKRGLSFVRYADDIAIYVKSQRAAQRVLESVMAWIEKTLKVPVNHQKSGSGPSGQSSLLGFRLYEDGRVGVSPRSIERMKERVRWLWHQSRSLSETEQRKEWRRYIDGWWNYFKLADWRREVQDLSGWIRRHIRKWYWQRWKTPRGRANALRRLGVNQRGIGNAYCGLGAWAMSCHVSVNHAMKTRWIKKQGLGNPWEVPGA